MPRPRSWITERHSAALLAFAAVLLLAGSGRAHGNTVHLAVDPSTGRMLTQQSVPNGYAPLRLVELELGVAELWDARQVDNTAYIENATDAMSLQPRRETYDVAADITLNLRGALRVWDGTSFVETGGEVLGVYEQVWSNNAFGEWWASPGRSIVSGGNGEYRAGIPYDIREGAAYRDEYLEHWHYLFVLHQTEPGKTDPDDPILDPGVYLAEVDLVWTALAGTGLTPVASEAFHLLLRFGVEEGSGEHVAARGAAAALVPEPGSGLLLAFGLALLASRRRARSEA